MKSLTKKCTVFLLLLIASHHVHAAKSAYQPIMQLQKGGDTAGLPRAKRKRLVQGYCSIYGIPKTLCSLIIYFVHDNPLQYKNKPLPNDLSEQDLSGYDFTGCNFTHTNLTYANLENVILTNTTCDYQKAFQYNKKKNKLKGGTWYQNNLPLDLKSITEVYPKLNNNRYKAKLLQVASGISQLSFYEDAEFYIKVQYWSSELLQLKQALGSPYGKQLVCSLTWYLNDNTNNYCWKTKYPQDKVSIAIPRPHANFDTYLKNFSSGLMQYECKSHYIGGFNCYKSNITKNIEGLKATYPHIKEATLQQEICGIAHALSKSYQVQKGTFLNHYLFYQHRLIRLKKLVSVDVKNEVCYSNGVKWYCYRCWDRG